MNKTGLWLAPALLGLHGAAWSAEPAPTPGPADAPFAASNVMPVTDLATITGRADTAMEIRAQNSSVVSNNMVVGQSETGAIAFDGQAFGNLAGLSLLSANTGNNVSINSSLNLNVAIHP